MSYTQNTNSRLINLQHICLQQHIPFVSYRLPLETEVITMVQQHSLPKKLDSLQNIDQQVGFLVSPFNETNEHRTYLLEPDGVFVSNQIDIDYVQQLANNNRFVELRKTDNLIQSTSATEYIDNVHKALETIRTGVIHKVVLSKVRTEQIPKNFQPELFFQRLCEHYPYAMVYMLQLPDVGCWIGATPEPLLTIENKIAKTASLASTQLATGAKLDSYQWNTKEIEEQNIVTDFVEKTLLSLGITEYKKTGPTNIQAANLIHLKTVFEFSETILQKRLGSFLGALHPTPSVGGLPKMQACDFILQNEKHDRAYYTGFLGPINRTETSAIFVNLRCVQLLSNQFVLYGGAGITGSSVPENEWTETDNKMMTIMNVIKN